MVCERRQLDSSSSSSSAAKRGETFHEVRRRYESITDQHDLNVPRSEMHVSPSLQLGHVQRAPPRLQRRISSRASRHSRSRQNTDTDIGEENDVGNASGGNDDESEELDDEMMNDEGDFGADIAVYGNATELLNEELYIKAQWKYEFIRLPRLPLWVPYRMERIEKTPEVPSVERIYSFLRHLFVEAELSSECSVVCLIYMERLMERADVDLLASNWRPILLACMLLASKVWQDLSSWNIEFSKIYPHFSVRSINDLERTVLKLLQWDLYISGAVYAKYYFALRSLNESRDFRRRYNYIMRVGGAASRELEKRSAVTSKNLYSRSM